jgi:hypothetical protein
LFLCSCCSCVRVVLASLCCSSFASHEPTKVARPCQRVRCQHSKKQSQGQQPKKQRRARALHDKKRPPQRTQQVRPCVLFCCDCFFVLLLTLFLSCFSCSVFLLCFSSLFLFPVSLPCFFFPVSLPFPHSHAKQGNYVNPHVYKRHVPKRVVQRPAFGSAVPRSPSPEKKSPPHTSPKAQITGKSARRNRNRNRGLGNRVTTSSGAQGASPGSPPQLQRRELRAGWSPAIIRGTSVTAHTHTSSHTVLAHAHRTMTGVVNAKEEDLGLAANSAELFQKELRN